MKNTSRVFLNTFYNLTGQALVVFLNFLAVRYVFKGLGGDALGIIYFTLTVGAVLSAALELGICSTLVREIAAHRESDPAHITALIRTASLFYWGAYAALAIALYFAAPALVARWIHPGATPAATATRLVQILGVASLAALPRAMYVSLFRGSQRMEFNNLIDVGTGACQQLGIVLILAFGGGLFAAVGWLTISMVLSLLTYVLVCARLFSFRALLPGFSATAARRNAGFAASMMLISLLAMVHTHADKIIVSKLLPIGVFGFYAVASSLVSRANLLSGAAAQAAFPAFAVSNPGADPLAVRSHYRILQDLACFATVPVYAGLVFAAGPLFTFLLDAAAARQLVLPVALLGLGYYMNGTLQLPYVASLAADKPGITVRLNFYALFIALPATALLTARFGIAGAAFGWVVYHVFAYAYAAPKFCSECLGIAPTEWFLHVLRAGVLAAATYGTAWVLLAAEGVETIAARALAYAVATLVFAAGAYALLGSESRAVCRRSLAAIGLHRAEAG